jgi:hypothetical protein
MDTEHTVFLIAGVVIVFVVGRLIVQSGRSYIADDTQGQRRSSAGSGANLVAVLFHLATLGLVALIAVIPLGGTLQERFLLRIGLLLLVLAVVYGITLSFLNRRREEAIVAEIETNPRRAGVDGVQAVDNGIGGVDYVSTAGRRPAATVRVEPREEYPERGSSMDAQTGTALGKPDSEHSL